MIPAGSLAPSVCYLHVPKITALKLTIKGLGETGATGLTDFFQFWCYVTPILGAIVSDQYLGKYNTIMYSAFIYTAGVLILFATSLPTAIEHGAALGGLIAAMVTALNDVGSK